MKVNNILDIFGALILATVLIYVAGHPQIVSAVGSNFNTALKTARGG